MVVRIIQTILGIAGLAALTLGLLFWFAHIDLISIHMLFGLTVALALLVISIIALNASVTRILGVIGIVYALILPVFGLRQATLLVGNMHWLIQTLHMLLGIGSVVYAGITGTRYLSLKRSAQKTQSQGVQSQKG